MTATFTLTGRILDKSKLPVSGLPFIINSGDLLLSDPAANETYVRNPDVRTNVDGYLCSVAADGSLSQGVPLVVGTQYTIRGVVDPQPLLGPFDSPAAGATLDISDIVPVPADLPPTWNDDILRYIAQAQEAAVTAAADAAANVSAQLAIYRDDTVAAKNTAVAAAQQAHDISNISTSDDVMTAVANDKTSDFYAAQSASTAGISGFRRINFVAVGDSYTQGNGLPIPERITSQVADGTPDVVTFNMGKAGETSPQILARVNSQLAARFDPTPGTLNVATVWAGTNDLNEPSPPSTADARARIVALHQAVKAAGFLTIGITLVPAVGVNNPSDWATRRTALNNSLRNDHTFMDGFVDTDTIPALVDAAEIRRRRFWFDDIHLSGAGTALVVALVKREIARLGGLGAQWFRRLTNDPLGVKFVPASAFAIGPNGPVRGDSEHDQIIFEANPTTTAVVSSVCLPIGWTRVERYAVWAIASGNTVAPSVTDRIAHFSGLAALVPGNLRYGNGTSVSSNSLIPTTNDGEIVSTSMGTTSGGIPALNDKAFSYSLTYQRNLNNGSGDTYPGKIAFYGILLRNMPMDADSLVIA